MKLRALEIQGFKSFADKTKITFDKPVTCVVGPNGSGKSNISDAILWVTGEQSSKALRGGKMEDVIFGGTEKRRQMGYAEVSLILDNSDSRLPIENTEVMITRRYYRSGESEYYINRRLCRLKDVNELLMDTGMGREGYSIIGQGRIDEILSAKSTDRRAIFEEAAGISRYRHRKEESERKLERTEENLLRVNDKISELELQVEPLRKQAETAKRYLILRDELRGVEISLWADSLEKLADGMAKLKTNKSEADIQLEQAKREIESFYAETETFSQRIREKDVQAEELRRMISENEQKSAELDSITAVLNANLESNAAEAARIESEISEQADRDVHIKEQIEERRARIGEIDAELSALEEENRKISDEMKSLDEESAGARRGLSGLLLRENELTEKLAEERAAVSALAATAQELEDRDASAARDALAAKQRLSQAEEGLTECESALSGKNQEKQSFANMIKGFEMRAENRRKKLAEAEQTQRRLEMDYQALNSRIALLTEMEKEYQGYSKAVKTVMQEAERGTLRGVHGTVGSLIKARQKYAVAIETALGAAMQNIIVENDEAGKAGINMLKRRDAGRATFAPMTTIRGSVLRENGLENEDGFEGLAIELASFDRQYTGIYTSLLGRVAVVETLDDAVKIGRKYSNRFRIVTLDGQVVNTGGSMTGGSATKNSGILSRSNELETLKARCAGMKGELSATGEKCRGLQAELTDAERELADAEERLSAVSAEVLKLETECGHYKMLLEAARQSVESLREDSRTLQSRLEANGQETARRRAAIAQLEGELTQVRGQSEELTHGQTELSERLKALSDKAGEIREKQASYMAERLSAQSAAGELERLRAGLAGGRERQSSYIGELKAKSEELKAQIESRRRQLDGVAASIARLRGQADRINEEKLEIEGECTRHSRQMQERNNELLNLERECARLEQRLLAAGLEEKQIIDKLWDTYELTRSAAMELKTELPDIAEAKKQAAELKRSITKLGNPNLGAIEEYERVNSRYTYLTEQRDDIEKAKRELTGIIDEITEEMRGIFAREFKAINEQFKKTFLELFGGGRADLELEDENDILNCGIEIKVQPPGKSLKTITLLSGGEKAFVAIALYFSVLKVRPAPFVVMDEIEAALDEANVLRFAEYMRQMSANTQMVVISHRRGTMEEADVLYGVTMQEQGVSRVIDIDLDEAEKTIVSDR